MNTKDILTEQDEKFCLLLMQGNSQAKSVLEAYGVKTGHKRTKEFLETPKIANRLKELREEFQLRLKEVIAPPDEVMAFLTSVIREDGVERFMEKETIKTINGDIEKMKEFTKSIPTRDKVRAAEILLKKYMFEQRDEFDGKYAEVIVVGEEEIKD